MHSYTIKKHFLFAIFLIILGINNTQCGFHPSTIVSTQSNEYKKISELKKGDLIACFNNEYKPTYSPVRVIQTFPVKKWVMLFLEKGSTYEMVYTTLDQNLLMTAQGDIKNAQYYNVPVSLVYNYIQSGLYCYSVKKEDNLQVSSINEDDIVSDNAVSITLANFNMPLITRAQIPFY